MKKLKFQTVFTATLLLAAASMVPLSGTAAAGQSCRTLYAQHYMFGKAHKAFAMTGRDFANPNVFCGWTQGYRRYPDAKADALSQCMGAQGLKLVGRCTIYASE